MGIIRRSKIAKRTVARIQVKIRVSRTPAPTKIDVRLKVSLSAKVLAPNFSLFAETSSRLYGVKKFFRSPETLKVFGVLVSWSSLL